MVAARRAAAVADDCPASPQSIETRRTLSSTPLAGVASRPAVIAEVIVRHSLGPVLPTEYMSPLESRRSPVTDVRLIRHRGRR